MDELTVGYYVLYAVALLAAVLTFAYLRRQFIRWTVRRKPQPTTRAVAQVGQEGLTPSEVLNLRENGDGHAMGSSIK